MPSYNKVLLMGHLTRDIDLRYTPNGKSVANMGLAINRKYKVNDEWQEEACFVDIVIWGDQAERCNEYLTKGDACFIEGRLQFRSWETDDGQKRSKLEVVAESVRFLNNKNKTEDDNIPF